MENKIMKILKSYKEITDWTLEMIDKNRDEMYLIFNETESLRNVTELEYFTTIYVTKEIDGVKYTGSGSRTFTPDMTESEIRKQVEETIFSASLALNPYYSLPEKEDNSEEYPMCDREIAKNRKETLEKMRNSIYKNISAEKGVRMASAEVFLTYSKVKFLTSKGIFHKYDATKIMLEIVMLAGQGKNEVESHLIRNERFLSVLDIENLIPRYAKYARDNINASIPKSGKYDVIFTEESLADFFNYYLSQTSGASIYNKISKFKLNDELVKDAKGDHITLSYDPTLPGGLRTGKYDYYGTLLKKFTFVKDGVFTKIAADKKYADYLKCEPTGFPTNLVAKPGNKTFKELLTDRTFIISQFSTFIPNKITGGFSGELRNGLFYKDGKFIPIKGGSVTGMMDKAMKEVYFSKETVQGQDYFGPYYIKVCNLNITGD
jgi:PmbA protein